MGTELTLRHDSAERLREDFESNLRKGRAFVPGPPSLAEREFCTLCIEPPSGGAPLRVRAEAVWIDPGPPGGTGLSFVDFDSRSMSALRAFVEAAAAAPPAAPELQPPSSREAEPNRAEPNPAEAEPSSAPDGDTAAGASTEPGSDAVARNLHDRVRALDLDQRDALARHGGLPERVALERRYGSSIWEGLLHNPQITPREVLRMAKSTSLPTSLVNLIVNNRAWVADGAINQALLNNPRVSGAHVDRVLRALPQAEILRVAEQASLRMQVRQAAKKLVRR